MKRKKNPFHFLSFNISQHRERTKTILHSNPKPLQREEAEKVEIQVYDYSADEIEVHHFDSIEESKRFHDNGKLTWIDIGGIRTSDVQTMASYFKVHPLIVEDVLSIYQRPKMDEIEGLLFCLLNMLYFNESEKVVEAEQISIILGKDFLVSLQADPSRDVFDETRKKLMIKSSGIRQRGVDYLLYSMLDMIVDNYFKVMERIGDEIEVLEEELIRRSTTRELAKINSVRKELIVLKRNITPVRDLINGILRSESDLIEERSMKYFKDIYDHIVQAYDLSENYRDIMINMQDLYINNVNLRMNEVMKVMAIVTCLMAPATVIGGIFGMNFRFIPLSGHYMGFFITVAVMLVIPLLMLFAFKKRGWF